MLLGRCFPSIAPIQLGRVPLLKEPLCCFLWSLNLCAVCPEQTTDGRTRNTRAKALYSFETKTKWHDCTIMIHIWFSYQCSKFTHIIHRSSHFTFRSLYFVCLVDWTLDSSRSSTGRSAPFPLMMIPRTDTHPTDRHTCWASSPLWVISLATTQPVAAARRQVPHRNFHRRRWMCFLQDPVQVCSVFY